MPNLSGARSDFPNSIDVIPTAVDGRRQDNAVTSEDVNLLGDCLINIQTYIDESTPVGGGEPTFFTVATITATIAGAPKGAYAQWTSLGTTIVSENNGMSSVVRTPTSMPPGTFWLSNVSAIGWITNGGAVHPVSVHPMKVVIKTSGGNTTYAMGFYVLPWQTFERQDNWSFTTNSGRAHGVLAPAVLPAGTLTVKILAFGGEVQNLYTTANA